MFHQFAMRCVEIVGLGVLGVLAQAAGGGFKIDEGTALSLGVVLIVLGGVVALVRKATNADRTLADHEKRINFLIGLAGHEHQQLREIKAMLRVVLRERFGAEADAVLNEAMKTAGDERDASIDIALKELLKDSA